MSVPVLKIDTLMEAGLQVVEEKGQIKVVKQPQQSATLLNRRDTILKRVGDAQSEIGRLNRLLDELRADVSQLPQD